jgi:hypothetical protein
MRSILPARAARVSPQSCLILALCFVAANSATPAAGLTRLFANGATTTPESWSVLPWENDIRISSRHGNASGHPNDNFRLRAPAVLRELRFAHTGPFWERPHWYIAGDHDGRWSDVLATGADYITLGTIQQPFTRLPINARLSPGVYWWWVENGFFASPNTHVGYAIPSAESVPGMYELHVGLGVGLDGRLDDTRETLFEVWGDWIGDLDASGAVNAGDIAPFVAALVATGDPLADVNLDGAVENLDIAPFVELLAAGRASVPEPTALAIAACALATLAGYAGLTRMKKKRP